MKFSEWFERYRAEQGQLPSQKTTWDTAQKQVEIELAHRDIEIERLTNGIKEVWKGIDATGRRMCEQGVLERDDGERVFGYAVMLKMILKERP